MRALLLYPDRDFDGSKGLPNAQALRKDFRLDILFDAMAQGDAFIASVVRMGLLCPVQDVSTLLYRQEVLRDCLAHRDVVEALYDVAVRALGRRRDYFLGLGRRHPAITIASTIDLLEALAEMLAALHRLAEDHRDTFASTGFRQLLAALRRELDAQYLDQVHALLEDLRFRHGVYMTARLGPALKGRNYTVRRPPSQALWTRVWSGRSRRYQFVIPDRDEQGHAALADLVDQGLSRIAQHVAGAADHVLDFFSQLRTELAFYLGAANLYRVLGDAAVARCSFPTPLEGTVRRRAFAGLFDICLALESNADVVGNDLEASDARLVVVTGANQGGKSTFLRSVGIAQLMMQCGLFVPARSFEANVALGVFTHFPRQEDVHLEHGKLEEELERMDRIADHLTPGALVLLNESFAATNEQEGAQLARQIVLALVDAGVTVFFVTHLHAFARGAYDDHRPDTLFLRAERLDDGTRTFRIKPGAPLETSHAQDLFRQTFAE